ncbi:MAG: hypothetical protein ABFS38_14765 [Bacteroidota bacterium]
MRSLIILIVISTISVPAFSQSDSILVKQVFGGYKFEQNGKVLNGKALLHAMENDQKAYEIMKKAKTNTDVGNIFGYTGSFLVGWTLGGMIAGGEPSWTMAGIGAGCLIIGIPLIVNGSKNTHKAVEIYNSHLGGTAFHQGLKIKVGVTHSGIGLALNF